MANSILDPEAIALSRASRTNTGRQIVIDWGDAFDRHSVQELHAAMQSLVDDGIAQWVRIHNGRGGWDSALLKL